MKAHVKQRLIAEQAASQEKLAARHAQEQSTGKATAPPKKGPRDKDQYNFADPASRIMKMRGGSEQCYNAQAVVEVTKMRI